MWKWIDAEVQKRGRPPFDARSIAPLKRTWLATHGYSEQKRPTYHCFFCEYALQRDGLLLGDKSHHSCPACPGRLVSKKFRCEGVPYCWCSAPHEFYKKLLELNEKRKKNKRRKKTSKMIEIKGQKMSEKAPLPEL